MSTDPWGKLRLAPKKNTALVRTGSKPASTQTLQLNERLHKAGNGPSVFQEREEKERRGTPCRCGPKKKGPTLDKGAARGGERTPANVKI